MSELQRQQRQFSTMYAHLILWLHDEGYSVRVGDLWRSPEKLLIPTLTDKYSYQELLVYNKRSKLAYGKHNDRLAGDLLIECETQSPTPLQWHDIGEHWEQLGGRWGGRFGVKVEEYGSKIGWDAGHFEL